MIDKAEVISRLDIKSFYESELPGFKPAGNNEIKTLCPFHDDSTPSFSANIQTGMYRCFACNAHGDIFNFYMQRHGVDFSTALKALAEFAGATESESHPNDQTAPRPSQKSKKETARTIEANCTAVYHYKDDSGKYRFSVRRFEEPGKIKTFRQCYYDYQKGTWVQNVKGIQLIPYRLNEVVNAESVFICEGEKDCDNLAALGLTASCNAAGAGKWKDEYSSWFIGKQVVILPDNDEPGRSHAEDVARKLGPYAASIRVINLPGLQPKGDVSDWLSAGGTVGELKRLVQQAGMEAPPQGQAEAVIPPMPPAEEDGTDTTHASFLPPPPLVPIDVFPPQLQRIIQESAKAYVVPHEVPVCAVLALASAAIGRSRGIIIKQGWAPHANLYLCLVGPSGAGKSPCSNSIFNSVFRADCLLHAEWQEARESYQLEQTRYQEALKQYRKNEIDDPGPAPEKPKRKQVFVDDATVEALTDALSDNPRGVLWLRDELAGLILDLDKYSGEKGSTKTRLMSAYDSGSWKVSRVNQGRTGYIQHACLSIFGGIQPGALVDAFCGKDAATGFLPRFLFVRFEQAEPALWTDHIFSNERKSELDRITRYLMSLDFNPNGQPQYIGVSGEAKELYVEWHNRLSRDAWAGLGDDDSSVLSKLRDQCLRLCLIIHLLEAATGIHDELTAVTSSTMSKAIQLADWFREHQRHVWSLIGHAGEKAVEAAPLERRVAKAITDLQAEVQNGALPTGRIAEKLNAGVDEAFKLDPRAIGKACSKLGLKSKRSNAARMIAIDNAAFSRLQTLAGVESRPYSPTTCIDLPGNEVVI